MYVLKHDDRKNNAGYSGYGYFSRYYNKQKGTFELVHCIEGAKQFYMRTIAVSTAKNLNKNGWKFKVVDIN